MAYVWPKMTFGRLFWDFGRILRSKLGVQNLSDLREKLMQLRAMYGQKWPSVSDFEIFATF